MSQFYFVGSAANFPVRTEFNSSLYRKRRRRFRLGEYYASFGTRLMMIGILT